MIKTDPTALVLALRPFGRGLAFALFEDPLCPVDWGIKEIRGAKRNARSVAAVRALIEYHDPEALALPLKAAERSGRTDRLLALIANHAVGEAIEVRRYTEGDVRACFAGVGAVSRYEIAQAIASQVHALAHRLPPVRKTWANIDARMYLFDAAALAMTYYATKPEEG